VDMLERHARKGRLVYVSGVLQTRRWRKDGEDSDRFSTEIRLARAGGFSSWIARTAPTGPTAPVSPRPDRRPPRRLPPPPAPTETICPSEH